MQRILLIAVMALLSCHWLGAQQPINKDSLLMELRTAKDDTAKIKLLLAVQKIYSTRNFDSSFYYLNQANDLALKLRTDEFDYTINNKFSIYYYFNNDYKKSIDYALKSKEVAERKKDLKLQARMYNNIAGIHNHFGQPKEAIDYILKCLDIAVKAGDSSTFSNYNVTASETYANLRQLDKAVVYAKRGIEYGRKFNDVASVTNGLNNLSVCYAQLYKLDSAVIINQQQLELAKQQQSIVYINYALVNLCYNNFRNGNTKAVSLYANELRQYIKDLPDQQLAGESHVAFAFHFIGKQKYDEARAELDSGILIAKADSNSITLENLYKTYSALYYVQGKIKDAEQYIYKSDSVVSKRNLNDLNLYARDLEKKYETEKKEAQLKLQEVQLRQKSMLNYFLIAGAVVLAIILLLSFRNYKHRQKLQQAKIDELETEKQLDATAAVLKGEEQERTRLAKDLHDGLGGMLSGIKHSLNRVKGNLIMTPDNTQAFERSIDMLDSSIKEMRRVAHNMMPEILVKYGLNTALKEFCSEIDRTGVVQLNYQSLGITDEIEQTTAVAIYRIVQELVNNALKHSSAQNVLVQLHFSAQDKLLAVTVEDDGNGFDTNTLEQSGGMGWKSIQNRVEFLRGRVDIQSSSGKGTSVMIEINI